MIPAFKNRDYFMGISQAVKTIEKIAVGEIDSKAYLSKTEKTSPVIFLFFLIFMFIIFYIVGRGITASKYASTHNMSFWQAMFLANLMNNMGSRHHRRGGGGFWDDFSSGGGSFGGFSGGSFGGGSFGGGGAGGSW
jgi:uncharacterized protein